ncbi:MAG: VWA domain-containing protein, partial [Myxococcales bacterium]|nr:VWA domain-containing protein [Myxococcales bacterium]
VPWLLVVAIGGPATAWAVAHLDDLRHGAPIEWQRPYAPLLALGAVLVGVALFHLRRHKGASLAFTRVGTLAQVRRGAIAWLAGLPGALRVVAVVAFAVALGRPETFKIETREIDSVDIMIVLDMSKSMEETDMSPRRDRMDAALAVVRDFIAQRDGDRVGLAVFAQGAMLQCPLTGDMDVLDWIVADLRIGDVPELGTAIGDGLGMALGQLEKSEAKSKVVILLSDGDNNVVTAFTPEEAARMAHDDHVKVFTVLVGAEGGGWGGLGGMSVNPETLRNIANVTGGEFFRATDSRRLNASFDEVRKTLEKTRRVVKHKVPDRQLFGPLVGLGVLLLILEQVLAATRFRRFP